jgi:hypothetical protein
MVPHAGTSFYIIPSRTTIGFGSAGGFQHEKESTDFLFKTALRLVSLRTGYGYVIQDKDDNVTQSGELIESPVLYFDISAFSEADEISVSYVKYGFKFSRGIFILTPVSTLLFASHVVNSNVALSESAALAVTGVSVNKGNNTITVSEPRTLSEVYDYLQAYQSLVANTDLLSGGGLLSTVVGETYSLNSEWSLRLSAAPSGDWALSAINVTLASVLNLTNFELSGTLFFDASGTYTFTSCDLTSVDTVDGNETVVISPAGTTTIGNNLDVGNITINTPSKVLTLTGLIIGSDVVVLDSGTDTVLASIDQTSGTTFEYEYTSQVAVDVGVLKPGFIPQYIYGLTLGTSSSSLPIAQRVDRSYS